MGSVSVLQSIKFSQVFFKHFVSMVKDSKLNEDIKYGKSIQSQK